MNSQIQIIGFEMKMKIKMKPFMRAICRPGYGRLPSGVLGRLGEPSVPGFEASKDGFLSYGFEFRDRCRSGLSGTPGKRVLVKANRGFESLPVRSVSKDRVSNLPEAIFGWA